VTWMLVGIGIIVGVPLIVAAVGMLLPRDHLAQMSIELGADPGRVWALVSDIPGTARWRPDVRAVEMRAAVGGRTRYVETTRQGNTPFEIVSQQAPARQVVRVVDNGLPFGGTWTWELAPARAGTRLTISEAGFIRNPIFRVMSRLFFPPTATMDGYLRALARELGESAEPTVVRAR
jgi:uncharacterized protein YndB with AHSA1/START domain